MLSLWRRGGARLAGRSFRAWTAARLGWLSFTLWDLAGAGVWVAIWLGLGYGFTGNLAAASNLAVSTLGFIAAGVAALGLGWWLIATIRAERASRRPGP